MVQLDVLTPPSKSLSPPPLDEAAEDDFGEVIEITEEDVVKTPITKKRIISNVVLDDDDDEVQVMDVMEINPKEFQKSVPRKDDPKMDFILYNPVPCGLTGDSFITSIPSQILSWKPRIVYFPAFASAKECRTMIQMARTVGLAPSQVGTVMGGFSAQTSGIRTSSGTFINASTHKTGTLDLIEQKIARATMIPRGHGEAFNILRYEKGQKYSPHYDTFKQLGNGPMLYPSALLSTQTNERVATFLLYLSDVEEGGETVFPLENKDNQIGNMLNVNNVSVQITNTVLLRKTINKGSRNKAIQELRRQMRERLSARNPYNGYNPVK